MALQDELQHNQDNPENTLWTDRYRPKRFTDLLGDEVGIPARSGMRRSAPDS